MQYWFDICVAAVIAGLLVWCVIEAARTICYTAKKRWREKEQHKLTDLWKGFAKTLKRLGL